MNKTLKLHHLALLLSVCDVVNPPLKELVPFFALVVTYTRIDRKVFQVNHRTEDKIRKSELSTISYPEMPKNNIQNVLGMTLPGQ